MPAHVMMDLETWGTRPGSAIRSIGACAFDMRGHVAEAHPIFYYNIDDASCLDAGLVQDEDTVRWWSQQSDAAQRILTKTPVVLQTVAYQFAAWLHQLGGSRVKLWAHGASFDPVLWQAACTAVNAEFPVPFWNFRDTRTVYDMAAINLKSHRTPAMVHHYALDDCIAQSNAVAAGLRQLLMGENNE